jgi:hypothetical protein
MGIPWRGPRNSGIRESRSLHYALWTVHCKIRDIFFKRFQSAIKNYISKIWMQGRERNRVEIKIQRYRPARLDSLRVVSGIIGKALKNSSTAIGFWFLIFGFDHVSELWPLLKYFRSKLKNQKHIAVDVFFKAYPIIPLSGWSNLARRYL